MINTHYALFYFSPGVRLRYASHKPLSPHHQLSSPNIVQYFFWQYSTLPQNHHQRLFAYRPIFLFAIFNFVPKSSSALLSKYCPIFLWQYLILLQNHHQRLYACRLLFILAIFNFVTKLSSAALCISSHISFGNIQLFSTDLTMAQSVSKLFVCFQVMKYTVFTNRETAMLSTRGSLCSVSKEVEQTVDQTWR